MLQWLYKHVWSLAQFASVKQVKDRKEKAG